MDPRDILKQACESILIGGIRVFSSVELSTSDQLTDPVPTNSSIAIVSDFDGDNINAFEDEPYNVNVEATLDVKLYFNENLSFFSIFNVCKGIMQNVVASTERGMVFQRWSTGTSNYGSDGSTYKYHQLTFKYFFDHIILDPDTVITEVGGDD